MSLPEIPLFSCIIPVHNGEPFLDRCLSSILDQSEQRFEVIVVNDGSSDGSLALADQWAHRFPDRIRVLDSGHAMAQGIISSYLLAVSVARAPYLAFLEQDDVWSEHYLLSKASIFQSDPDGEVGVIFSPYRVLRDGFYGLDMVVRQFLLLNGLPRNQPFVNFGSLLQFNNVATFSAFVCRRELWNSIPRPPDAGTVYFDWWVLAHISVIAKFYFDTRSYICWRCSPETTLGRQGFSRHRRELTAFLRSLYKSLDQWIGRAESANQQTYQRDLFNRKKKSLESQLNLLNGFGAKALIAAFISDPDWSIRMLVSVLVNRVKKQSI